MQTVDGTVMYSATDLLTWKGCGHASWLDAQALTDSDLKDWLAERAAAERARLADGGFPEPASVRGDEHEANVRNAMAAAGLQIVDVPRPGRGVSLAEAARRTEKAMEEKADVVYQAALVDGRWFGYADFLVRVDGVPSRFGDYAYEVRDTKLARTASASALLQMAHYGSMLETLQKAPPPRLVVLLGNGTEFDWSYADAVPYLEELRRRFRAFHDAPVETVAEPVEGCATCRWKDRCDDVWGPGDVLNVHRLSRRQRALLKSAGVATIEALARDEAPRPEGMTEATFRRLQEQAKAQMGEEEFTLVRPQSRTAGIAGTPAPHDLDIYFDLEGDPYAASPTLDYLWAYCDAEGTYFYRWAHDQDEERRAFLWFLGELQRRDDLGGEWRVYHYNSYEVTAMERIAEAWPDAAESKRLLAEVERLVTTRFDDLYRRVEAGLRMKGENGRTSLKFVEKVAGYRRDDVATTVGRADESIQAYEAYLRSTDDAYRADLLEGLRQYNEHDVKATRAAHRWLHGLAGQLDDEHLTDEASEYDGPSADVLDRAERTAALQRELIEAATDAGDGGTVPSGLSAVGATMLAEMLEWHRREFVVAYLDHLRLREWASGHADGDAGEPEVTPEWSAVNGDAAPDTRIRRGTEHESCLVGVTYERTRPAVTNRKNEALVHEYSCSQGAWKLKVGSDVTCVVPTEDGKFVTTALVEHDPAAGTFAIKRRKRPPLGPFVATPFSERPEVWESLMRLGRAVLADDPDAASRTALDLLDRRPPLRPDEMTPVDGESAADRAVRLVGAMTGGVLPVQGPPGTGKTTAAARMVLAEVARAAAAGTVARIGVVANSHKVIDNLLEDVAEQAAERGVDLAIGHVGTDGQVAAAGVERIPGGGALVSWLDGEASRGRPAIAGATKFGWSRIDAVGAVHLLLVDEAGQLTLADALAVAQASERIVALGDPQQLASPIQATHDAAVRLSLLEHLAQGEPVLPPDVGVFLDVTHRMHPDVCTVVGALAYEGELVASEAAAARMIAARDDLPVRVDGRLLSVAPGVTWLPVDGDEERQAAVVAELIAGLADAGVTVTDPKVEKGEPVRLSLDEVLVVAPHNAHVNRITAQVEGRIEVGTVDRFQGKQAHVVVFAMGQPAEDPGDVPFLYEINRLNVALSRARLTAIVVAHPDAVFPPVSAPEHLRLASRFANVVRGRIAPRD